MIVIEDIEQGSDAWFKLKAGVPGAASFSRIVTSKGEPSKSRTEYIYQLAGEKVLGTKEGGFSNYSMDRGTELEPEARECFEFVTGQTIKQVGFVFRDEKRNVGCSPDGMLPNTGLELKCPMLKNHVYHMVTREIPYDKFHQIHGSMWICGFSSWIFMSYYPGMEPAIIEVERDYEFTSALEYEMELFLKDLDIAYNQIKGG